MPQELNFYLLTDTHYHSPENGFFEGHDQQCINESGAIIDATFDMLIADKDVDIVLIAGDLSRNGKKNEHREFIEKLRRLKDGGKRVFVITATHDYGLKAFEENYTPESIPDYLTYRPDLREMYYDFGRSEAIAEHESMSYTVQLAPGYRLLCLNDDGDGRDFCGYYDDHLQWILEQIEEAHKAGDYIFAMTHHPVLPPSPIYPMFSKRDMLGDYERVSTLLADAGLQYIFTGHTHMQNIALKTTRKGNKLYDINTGALTGYPTAVRRVTLDSDRMQVKTTGIESFDWDLQGKTVMQYMQDNFDFMLNDIFDAMAFDIDRLAGMAGGFSMDSKTIYKLRRPITFVGGKLQTLTLKKAARLVGAGKCVDKSVENVLLKDLVVELVRNIYGGDEPYSRGTPIYEALIGIIKKLSPILRRFRKKSEIFEDLPGFIASIIADEYPPDSNAILEVPQFYRN